MISLRLTQNRQHVKCGQKTTIFALAELAADDSTRILDRSKHVSLAIDCSGSMYGKKLDDAKRAAMEVAGSLSPRDTVSVVTFAGDVDVKLGATPASDPGIADAIRSIEAGGGTALHGGMATSFQQLKQASGPNTINRMVVISDGEPNVEPYDDADFAKLAKDIRDGGVTIDVFGIGNDYNGSLLMQIAETGRGKWEHVQDSDELTRMIGVQVEDMQNTVITSPHLQVTVMPGAEIATMAVTKPTLQEIDRGAMKTSGNTTSVGLADIIKDEAQAVAMRISVPPVEGDNVPLLTVSITEGPREVASQTVAVSCTEDKDLYNLESDPGPRVILASSEATILLRKGLEGDQEATRMADTILKSLEDPETTRLMDEDAQATVIRAKEISGSMHGGLSEADKKRVLHDTTVIGTRPGGGEGRSCASCGHALRPAAKVCGKCGKVISE